jgi:hypothetical protein
MLPRVAQKQMGSGEDGAQTEYGSGRSLTRPPLIRWGHDGDGAGIRRLPPLPRVLWTCSLPRARGSEDGQTPAYRFLKGT